MVKNVAEESEFDTLVGGDKPVIIDFTATWCGPCKMIGPIFAKLAEAADKAIFIKVDVDDASEISEKCGISAMPTFQVWKNGKKIDDFTGANEQKLKELVAKYN